MANHLIWLKNILISSHDSGREKILILVLSSQFLNKSLAAAQIERVGKYSASNSILALEKCWIF